MTLQGAARRVTVYIGEAQKWHHRPLYDEIVHRALDAGLAGASVFKGMEGYGTSHVVHTSRILTLSEDLPVAVVIVDAAEAVDAFLPQLEALVTRGLVVVDDVQVVTHRHTAEAVEDGG